MAPIKNLVGRRFGRLLVVSLASERKGRQLCWVCACECGNEVTKPGPYLTSGDTLSCGCLWKERRGKSSITHGRTRRNTPSELRAEYRVFRAMHERCENQKNKRYHVYGGRGIKVCERWSSFENFAADMLPRPSRRHQLDRENTNGNYEKGNCRWVLPKQQQRNRTNNRIVEYEGRSMSLAELAEISGIPYSTLRFRIVIGRWSIERAARTPVRAMSR